MCLVHVVWTRVAPTTRDRLTHFAGEGRGHRAERLTHVGRLRLCAGSGATTRWPARLGLPTGALTRLWPFLLVLAMRGLAWLILTWLAARLGTAPRGRTGLARSRDPARAAARHPAGGLAGALDHAGRAVGHGTGAARDSRRSGALSSGNHRRDDGGRSARLTGPP